MIAFEENPISITIITVSAVFKTILLFPEIYQTEPANNNIINMLSTTDSDRTHIPLKNSAPKERKAVFLKFESLKVDLIARTKNKITRAI